MAKKKLQFDFSSSKGSKVTLDDDKSEKEKLERMTAGLPDPGTAKLERYKKRPRVALTFSIPDLIKEEFCQKAIDLGFTRKISGITVADQKAMLYHMMRQVGIDVPEDHFIDKRRN